MQTRTLYRHYDYGNFEAIVSAAPALRKFQIRNVHRSVVESYFELGRFKEAKAFLLERVLDCVKEDESDTKEVYLLIARACLLSNEPEEALRNAKLAKKIEVEDYEVHYLIGRALLQLGQREEGIKSLSRAIRSDCIHFSRAYRNARTALNAKDYDRFVEDYYNARAYSAIIEPIFFQVYFKTPLLKEHRVFLKRAVDRIKNLFHTRDADMESFLAAAYCRGGDIKHGKEVAEGCLEVEPNNPYALVVLSQLAFAERRFEEALSHITQSLTHHIVKPSDFQSFRWEPGIQLNPLIYTRICKELIDLALDGIGMSHYRRFEFGGEEPKYSDLKRLREYAVSGRYRCD